MKRVRWRLAAAGSLLVALVTSSVSAGAAPTAGYGPRDNYGLFLNILPGGQGHSVNAVQAAQYLTLGRYPPNWLDQLEMYNRPAVSPDAITDRNLTEFFKPASMHVDPRDVVSVERPKLGVTIVRDRFGVPHIYGATRNDAMWATGYVTAQDRLFFADAFRHVGRGRLSEFLGASEANLEMDRATYLAAGYSEVELQRQVERASLFGELGTRVLEDGEQFVAGMNARITEILLDPTKLPAEYPALQLTPNTWKLTDLVAVATVIQAEFAWGGGGEVTNALLLAELQARFGRARGRALFDDLRERNDPEAPTTIDTRVPREVDPRVSPDAVAVPDPDSVEFLDPLTIIPPEGTVPDPTAEEEPDESAKANPTQRWKDAMAGVGLAMPKDASNWLGVTADRSANGHPVAVMGPQVGYFSPQVLMEIDVHAPGIDARGVTFPGVSLYVLLGRGPDYAWSATSGDSDLVDTRAERLCEPDGTTPSLQSNHYLFRGRCVPIYRRVDNWLAKPSGGGVAAPSIVRAVVERTVHGPVFARGMVEGRPVAFASQRTTFAKELDTAGTFALATEGKMNTPAEFRQAFSMMTGSFNWLWLSDRHLAYFHSGNYPKRAPGVDPDLPSWGTGDWEWRGLLPADDHPQTVDPDKGWMISWNNKPAPGWSAADNTYKFGAVHRSMMLAERLGPLARRGGVTPADLVRVMADAATVDLRGEQLLPELLRLVGEDQELRPYARLLRAWLASGAHRVDRDGDGQYEHQSAVALLDAWWEPLIHAMFDGRIGGLYDLVQMEFDDEDRFEHLGSSFNEGYYGYIDKALRMALGDQVLHPYAMLRCADGTVAGCRRAVRASLAAAVDSLGSDPSRWNADEEMDSIVYEAVGLVSMDPQPWQNRPTFQQVVSPTSHR